MENIKEKMTVRCISGMIIGNILMGLGVCIFKTAGMGNDTYTAMVMAAADQLHISYSTLLLVFNAGIFIIELIWGRRMIGPGTLVNWFLVGYVATFGLYMLRITGIAPQALPVRLVFVLVGVLITSLGLSLYQSSNAGIAPYDSISLILRERFHLPYFGCRVALDGTCALLAYLFGGLIGLGTLMCAFSLGPFVTFFNKTVTRHFLVKKIL